VTSDSTSYTERLTVPWWAWPATLAATAMLTAELAIGAFALRQPVTFAVAGALAIAGLVALSRIRIRLGDAFRVDDAVLPLSAIASVEPVDLEARRELLGVEADPMAFVIQRPWIRGGVRIDLADPDDPTPYWFISSRHPDLLVAAIEAARATVA
jgi:Protein of unknown function (DUF3093)